MRRFRHDWLRGEEGVTSVEYAVLLGMVGLLAFLGAYLFSQRVAPAFQRTAERVAAGGSPRATAPAAAVSPVDDAGDEAEGLDILRDRFDGLTGLAWQFYHGTWKTEDRRMTSPEPKAVAVAKVPSSDYTYRVTLQTLQPGSAAEDVARVLFRYQNAQNYYAVVPKTDGVLELAKMQNGQWRPWVAYARTGLDPTKPHTYEIRARGTRVQIVVDGVPYLDYKDANPFRGGGGVGVANAKAQGAISNVTVK